MITCVAKKRQPQIIQVRKFGKTNQIRLRGMIELYKLFYTKYVALLEKERENQFEKDQSMRFYSKALYTVRTKSKLKNFSLAELKSSKTNNFCKQQYLHFTKLTSKYFILVFRQNIHYSTIFYRLFIHDYFDSFIQCIHYIVKF